MSQKKHFHFIGIGGIGMSGIASILKQQGFVVSGCDTNITQNTVIDLKKLGCIIADHHNSDICSSEDITHVVYIQTYIHEIPAYNTEFTNAQRKNIILYSRAQMLAQLMDNYFTICVSGSHGKTTTSAMIAHILVVAKRDPTVVVGGYIKSIQSNARLGASTLFVAEADESDRSLLTLPTNIGVITNIDVEHLETYANLNDIQNTFKTFLSNVNQKGTAIICKDDANSQFFYDVVLVNILSFGLTNQADVYATDILIQSDYSTCVVHIKKTGQCTPLMLPVAGNYNILNALAAISACLTVQIPLNTILESLSTFIGVEQRFSLVGNYKGTEIFDDYGHHPTEIENVLYIAKLKTKGKLFVLFQPHRYTRTQALWSHFIEVFAKSPVDYLIITDIYPAFEKPIENIHSKTLVEELLHYNPNIKVYYIPYQSDFSSIKTVLQPLLGQNDLLLLLGAGRAHLLNKYLI